MTGEQLAMSFGVLVARVRIGAMTHYVRQGGGSIALCGQDIDWQESRPRARDARCARCGANVRTIGAVVVA